MAYKKIDINDLPEDTQSLRQIVMAQADELDAKDRTLKRMQNLLVKLLRWRYGPRRERVDENQLVLWAIEMVAAGKDIRTEEAEKKELKKRKHTPHGRQRLPGHLERKEVIYDVPEDQRECPHCPGEVTYIGDEVSERLDYKPATVFVIREVSRKYACENGCTVITAQKPMQPIEKGLAGPEL